MLETGRVHPCSWQGLFPSPAEVQVCYPSADKGARACWMGRDCSPETSRTCRPLARSEMTCPLGDCQFPPALRTLESTESPALPASQGREEAERVALVSGKAGRGLRVPSASAAPFVLALCLCLCLSGCVPWRTLRSEPRVPHLALSWIHPP